ncbi:hypothetical protein BB561_005153 [Smittium simulii]|uniref:DNA 3'-5' helicase n=1 Tax=Smittium simulii TaxID=133385 RepID=A0A2T9YBZ4_9FUNG|nr:hypothetical protein BB561_005153 [Smittium simulii]
MLSDSRSSTLEELSKLKKLLKTWENDYLQKNGKLPNKEGLAEFPEISERYKSYYKLKHSLLVKTPDRIPKSKLIKMNKLLPNSEKPPIKISAIDITPTKIETTSTALTNQSIVVELDLNPEHNSITASQHILNPVSTNIVSQNSTLNPQNLDLNLGNRTVSSRTQFSIAEFKKKYNYDNNNIVLNLYNDSFSSFEGNKSGNSDISDDNLTHKYSKTPTQKRQTKRVKLKPISQTSKKPKRTATISTKEKNIQSTPVEKTPKPAKKTSSIFNTDDLNIKKQPLNQKQPIYGLTSQNFTKMKIKNKRSNYGTLDRKRDYYKKMVQKSEKYNRIKIATENFNKESVNFNEKVTLDLSGEMVDFEIEPDTLVSKFQTNNNPKQSKISDPEIFDLITPHDLNSKTLFSVSNTFWCNMNIENTNFAKMAKDEFGCVLHNAIKRLLSGKSSLLIMDQTIEKRIIYELCAMITSCIAKLLQSSLVVFIICSSRAALDNMLALSTSCVSSKALENRKNSITNVSFDDITESNTRVVYLSAEQFISLPDNLNLDVSFVVLEDAHCPSQDSYDYKASYLIVGRKIKQSIKPRCVLATTRLCRLDLAHKLCFLSGLDPARAILSKPKLIYTDIHYRAVKITSASKNLQLVELATKFVQDKKRILIYCFSKYEAEKIVSALSLNKFESVLVYHSEISFQVKLLILEKLQKNTGYEIVVATMSSEPQLRNLSVDVIIHYTVPNTIEEYLNQTSRLYDLDRVVRYKKQSIVFIDDNSNDIKMKKARLLSKQIEESTIRKLLFDLAEQWIKNYTRTSKKQIIPATLQNVNDKNLSSTPASADSDLSSPSYKFAVIAQLNLQAQKTYDLNEHEINELILKISAMAPTKLEYLGKEHKYASIKFTRPRQTSSLSHLFCKSFVSAAGMIDIAVVANYFRTSPVEVIRKINAHQHLFSDCVVSFIEPVVFCFMDISDLNEEHTLNFEDSQVSDTMSDNEASLNDSNCGYSNENDTDLVNLNALKETENKNNSGQAVDLELGRIAKIVAQQYQDLILGLVKKLDQLDKIFKSVTVEIDFSELQYNMFDSNSSKFMALVNRYLTEEDSKIIGACETELLMDNSNVSFDNATQNQTMETGKALDQHVYNQLRDFISQHHLRFASGNAVAKLMYGISSPKYPKIEWDWTNMFGRFCNEDFEVLASTAYNLILEYSTMKN